MVFNAIVYSELVNKIGIFKFFNHALPELDHTGHFLKKGGYSQGNLYPRMDGYRGAEKAMVNLMRTNQIFSSNLMISLLIYFLLRCISGIYFKKFKPSYIFVLNFDKSSGDN